MTISFTDPSLPGQLQQGQVQTRRLQGGVRIRVTSGLVWLTIVGCRDDIWLQPGRCFDYHGRGDAIFEAVNGAAEFTVTPLPPKGCGDDPIRIAKLLPHGLIRWF